MDNPPKSDNFITGKRIVLSMIAIFVLITIFGGSNTPADKKVELVNNTNQTQPTAQPEAPAATPAPTATPVEEPVPTPTVVPAPTALPEPAPQPSRSCDPNYSGCVPIASDVDCAGGRGNGPAYVAGPVSVIDRDIYNLDADNDGIGCE